VTASTAGTGSSRPLMRESQEESGASLRDPYPEDRNFPQY
jgi:hypothetical protein